MALYIVDNWLAAWTDQTLLVAMLAFGSSLTITIIERTLLANGTSLRMHNLRWLFHIIYGLCFYGCLILLLKVGTPLVAVNRTSAYVVVIMMTAMAAVIFFTVGSPFAGILTMTTDPRRTTKALQRQRPMTMKF
jgi:hypothetical protein